MSFIDGYLLFALWAIPLTAVALGLAIVGTASTGMFMRRYPIQEAYVERFVGGYDVSGLGRFDLHGWFVFVTILLFVTEVALVELQVQFAPAHLVDERLRNFHWMIDAAACVALAGALICNGRSRRNRWHKFFVYPFIALVPCTVLTGAILEYPFYVGFA
jgi:hypothetical protein